jgi:hypothetical protein
MATKRENIYKDFLNTPADEQEQFCARYLARMVQVDREARELTGESPEGYMGSAFTALEQAICLDAGRKDLWDSFLTRLHSGLKQVASKKRREKKLKKAQKSKETPR